MLSDREGGSSVASDTDSEAIPTLHLESKDITLETVIEDELQRINAAIDEINNLSTEFTNARSKFVEEYDSAKDTLRKLYSASRGEIEKARPYYKARDDAYQAKYELRRAAAGFRKASQEFDTARSDVRRAEQALMTSSVTEKRGTQDIDILGNLNAANDKVAAALRLRAEAEAEQVKAMDRMSQTDGRLALLAHQLTKYIHKASTYFDTRDQLQRQLDVHYSELQARYDRLQETKLKHADMFSQFNAVSVEFEQRTCAGDVINAQRDLSRFQEVDDLESLGYNFDEVKHRSRSFDMDSFQSDVSSDMAPSTTTKNTTHTARMLSAVESKLFNEEDSDKGTQHYRVEFQMNL